MFLTLAIVFPLFCAGAYFLSLWLNKLYTQNVAILSFPEQMASVPLKRVLKIAPFALFLLYLKAATGTAFLATVFFGAFLAFTLTFFMSDVEQQVIFDKQLLPFAVCGALYSFLLRGEYVEPVLAACGAGAFFLLLAVLTRGGIGGGDIKLVAALGLWGGLEQIYFTSIVGIILGGVWALFAMLFLKKGRKDFIPYGPSLIIAAILAHIY